MKTIKITNGTYGQRLNGRLIPVRLGNTCRVEDQEAARLVALKVAAYVEEGPEALTEQEESGGGSSAREGTPDAYTQGELENMTRDSLLKIAAQLGLEVNTRMSKADIIQRIHETLAHDDGPTPPDLSPEDPVI